MKITKDIFLKATAEAMKQDETKKLFKSVPDTFALFSSFAFALFIRLEGKDVTLETFSEEIANVVVDTLPENVTPTMILTELALATFSAHIWTELEKLDKPEKESSESDNFESELKSLINT